MEVEADFLGDWQLILVQRLEAVGARQTRPFATVQEVAKQYYNLLRRLIPMRPRCVLRSREFTCPAHRTAGLELLESRIRSGQDLTPHLSLRIEKPWFDDALLNHWDIQHFHLGENTEVSGFMSRTPELLFVRMSGDAAYFIDVLDHQSFSDRRLFEVLQSNWPKAISAYSLPCVKRLDVDTSIMDIAKLREAGVNSIMQTMNNKFYLPPGGGVTTSGLSAEVSALALQKIHAIRRCEAAAKDRVSEIVALAAQERSELGSPLRLRLDLVGDEAWAVEEATGVRIRVGLV